MRWRLNEESRIFVWKLIGLQLLIHALQFVYTSPAGVQVNIHENRISSYNNSKYVAQIMRLAKSAEMRNYMNPEVNACDNFYEYACGNWPKLHPAEGSSKRKTSIFTLLDNSYKQKQLRLLKEEMFNEFEDDALEEEKLLNDPKLGAVKKVKDFFKSCRNMGLKKRSYVVKELREIIEEFGKMPALLAANEDWLEEEERFDWLKTIGLIQSRYGFDIILQLGVRADFENKTINTLFVGQPSLKLKNKSMYLGVATGNHRQDYQRHIQENLEDFLGLEEEKAKTVAHGILNFEIELAKGLLDFKSDKTLKSKSIKRKPEEFVEVYGEDMDLAKFVNTALGFEWNASYYEYTPEYQENLKEVINATSKQQLANYIYYHLVEPFFIGYDVSLSRMDDMCLENTKKFFSHILDNMIYRTYNTQAMQNDIIVIWQEIKNTFKAQMESTKMEWLTPMTRKLALEKLERIQLHINSYDNRNFTEEYKDLTINSFDYIENLKNINHRRVVKFLEILLSPGKLELPAHMLSYSPAFINSENIIMIPISLLQPNYLWSDYYPEALKFGTLGFLLAHELIHGFDDFGKQYDSNGNELDTWWDEQSTKAFMHKKACFKAQYSRYRYSGKYLPPSDLQAENIADNGAVQLAFKSYIHWLNMQALENLEELLPHIKLNNRKLFFLGYAQFFCMDMDSMMKDKVSLLDVHAPNMYRVIGPLANFPEFAKIFKCPEGSTLNPKKKCEIY
ncbi:neprilysin-4-like [Lucilia sericata]|uniref:neprilysin-4-like n=1 Tax=Lucilia sericata TaxID=13632 RepID=UPI0018A84F01|nr:neprilysin-4-like [Lucilia sericata]